MGPVHLSSKLANVGSHQDHGDARAQEDLLDQGWQSKSISTWEGSATQVRSEDNEHNHELTPDEVAIKIVALVGKNRVLVGDRMALLVEIPVDRRESNQRSLSSFHHGEPDNGTPDKDKGEGRVDIRGHCGLAGKDESHNDDDRECEETKRVSVLENVDSRVMQVAVRASLLRMGQVCNRSMRRLGNSWISHLVGSENVDQDVVNQCSSTKNVSSRPHGFIFCFRELRARRILESLPLCIRIMQLIIQK